MSIYTGADVRHAYEAMTGVVTAKCRFVTPMVGGQPAGEEGVRAFVKYQLKLEGAEAEKAVLRIQRDEIGTKQVSNPEGGDVVPDEIEEKATFGINVIRRSSFGPYLGHWMVKACLKSAASICGLTVLKKGIKTDFAEMGAVEAFSTSRHTECSCSWGELGSQYIIHLVDGDGNPAVTEWERFRGRVKLKDGTSVSIVHDSEIAPVGTYFSFQFRWRAGRVTDTDMLRVFGAATNIGLGSCKSYERGKFEVLELTVTPGEIKQKATGLGAKVAAKEELPS